MAGKNIVAIIPARGGSKGIPKKNIIDFCGKPLIAWSIQNAIQSELVQDVHVSSDSDEILEVSKAYGAKVIKRPSELALDTTPSELALIHALEHIEPLHKNVDLIVFLQVTSPLRLAEDIDTSIRMLYDNSADSLFSCNILDDFLIDTNTIWEKNSNDHLVSVTYDYQNRLRRQDHKSQYLENGSIYLTKPEILKTCNNRLGGSICFYPMKHAWQAFEIDSPEGVEICQWYMQNKLLTLKQGTSIDADEIELIVYDFDGVMTDNRAIVLEDGTEGVYVNRSDGLAVQMIRNSGIPQIIISTEANRVVESRAKKIGIPIIYNVKNKKRTLLDHCAKQNVSLNQTIYVGNDINDFEAMQLVGYPVAPQDAHPQIKSIAQIILGATGGSGVVRELFDIIHNQSLS